MKFEGKYMRFESSVFITICLASAFVCNTFLVTRCSIKETEIYNQAATEIAAVVTKNEYIFDKEIENLHRSHFSNYSHFKDLAGEKERRERREVERLEKREKLLKNNEVAAGQKEKEFK